MKEVKREKKRVELQIHEELYKSIQDESRSQKQSINRLLVEIIGKVIGSKEIEYSERILEKNSHKKLIESRVRFTESEAEILKEYAQNNGWSLTQEIRYRVVGSISKIGKISGEEMKLIREIKGCINVLGANINRIIRDGRIVDMEGKDTCGKLITEMKKLKAQIDRIEDNSKTRFIVK